MMAHHLSLLCLRPRGFLCQSCSLQSLKMKSQRLNLGLSSCKICPLPEFWDPYLSSDGYVVQMGQTGALGKLSATGRHCNVQWQAYLQSPCVECALCIEAMYTVSMHRSYPYNLGLCRASLGVYNLHSHRLYSQGMIYTLSSGINLPTKIASILPCVYVSQLQG